MNTGKPAQIHSVNKTLTLCSGEEGNGIEFILEIRAQRGAFIQPSVSGVKPD